MYKPVLSDWGEQACDGEKALRAFILEETGHVRNQDLFFLGAKKKTIEFLSVDILVLI